MYTQCTNCKTLFRISEEQLELLEGKVRCGFCYNTFNAYDALYEDLPSDSADAEYEEEEEQEEAASESAEPVASFSEPAPPDEPEALDELDALDELEELPQSFATPSLPQDLAQEYAAEGVRVNARHLTIPTPTPPPPPRPLPPINRLNTPAMRTPQPTPTPAPAPAPRSVPAEAPPRPQAAPRPVRREPTPPPQATPRSEPPAARAPQPPAEPLPVMKPPPVADAAPRAKPAPSTKPAPAAKAAPVEPAMPRFDTNVPPMPKDDGNSQLPNLFDAIDLAGRELQQVSRFELDRRRGAHDRRGLAATFGWGIATLVLIAVILFQVAYFARDELAKHAQLRPWLEQMCALAGCKIPLMRNVTLIKLVSRDIRVHPKITEALEVRATFVNDAPFHQPYPSLKLDLMDASGNRVATRQFEPREYLPAGTDFDTGFAPQQQVDVKLEIMDPERSAHGFEFSFL